MSFESCAICGPKRNSRALCNCCKQYLCLDHLKEHDDLLNAQIEPLVDHINQLLDQLTNFNIENLLQPIYFQLDQWKQTAIQSIENVYQEKVNQINTLVIKQIDDLRQQTEQVQKNLSQVIHQQDPTNEQVELLFARIKSIQKQTNQLENQPIRLNIHPFIINYDYIQVHRQEEEEEEEQINNNNNNQLILSPILQTISSTFNNLDCISNNDEYILVHCHPILYLYDHNLNLTRQTHPYSDLTISDMCWSIILEKFLILTNEKLFILNETNMILEKTNIPTPKKGHWHNLTCSLTNLYLTAYKWGTFIYEYKLNEFEFEYHRRWETPLTCSKDESIDHLIHNNKHQLVMIIQNRINYQKYFQLKNDQTLECLWSYQLDQLHMNIQRNRFCLIDHDQFLIINTDRSELIIYSENGLFKQIIEYNFNQPLRALLIKFNFIIITTKDSINLHQLIT